MKTRFAPSPTGYLHVGGARTALFCYLEARRRGGQFILRIEDTDLERSTPAAVQAILDGMAWLGLHPDEGPIYQTQRFARYLEVAEQLVASGHAYRCYCSKAELESMRADQEARGEKPRYNGYWRDRSDAPPPGASSVIRFKNPQQGEVVVQDRVRGRVVIQNAELDDLVIWRSDQAPTYNFAVVVDDHDMGVSDVIRGDDHLNNTPRQINIYRALGWDVPSFAHLPMILGPDGAKLSKRHGAVSVMQYRDDGFLPAALLNYLARLGWSHGDQEVFSIVELTKLFSADDVNHSASRFDVEKLRWLNQHYIKTLPADQLLPELRWHLQQQKLQLSDTQALDVLHALRERCVTLLEMAQKASVWFLAIQSYDEAAIAKHNNPAAIASLTDLRGRLAQLDVWNAAAVQSQIEATLASMQIGLGKIGPLIRLAITGTTVSPALDQTIYLAGQAQALARFDALLQKLSP
jgi:glutamyl-tRNA synthetase